MSLRSMLIYAVNYRRILLDILREQMIERREQSESEGPQRKSEAKMSSKRVHSRSEGIDFVEASLFRFLKYWRQSNCLEEK